MSQLFRKVMTVDRLPETVETIKKLLKQADEIRGAFVAFERYANDPGHYDKTGFGFNKDSRFCACRPIALSVDSWKGTYGSSSCSTQLSLDQSIFHEHLLKVLQDDFKGIMLKVEDSIRKEAVKLKEKAQAELSRELLRVNSL